MPDYLLSESDLAQQRGAPFTTEEAHQAGGTIRRRCGWHIAPARTETLTLDSIGGRVLMLPSLLVKNVTEVRDVTGSEPRVLAGWRWSADGMIEARGYWPRGFRAVEVDLVHGYDECPDELKAVAADVARRRVSQEAIGGRSVSYVAGSENYLDDVLAAFKIQARP